MTGGWRAASERPRLRPLVHPIYVGRGILPPVAAGLADADAQRGAVERWRR
jgi:hypothetical protein